MKVREHNHQLSQMMHQSPQIFDGLPLSTSGSLINQIKRAPDSDTENYDMNRDSQHQSANRTHKSVLSSQNDYQMTANLERAQIDGNVLTMLNAHNNSNMIVRRKEHMQRRGYQGTAEVQELPSARSSDLCSKTYSYTNDATAYNEVDDNEASQME